MLAWKDSEVVGDYLRIACMVKELLRPLHYLRPFKANSLIS